MGMRILIVMSITFFWLIGVSVSTSQAATTFVGSTIEGVDSAQQTITFRTDEGKSWTLRVADPNILKQKPVVRGDRVSIEIAPNNTITKIVMLSKLPPSGETRPPGPSRPAE